jgi:predicted transposase/invertase (TIGR01784 family)
MVSSQPDRYVSLLTDFGFKRVFGSESHKRLLIDFLNTILPPQHQIRDLSFKNPENLGQTEIDRKAIFDVYCEAQNGERFIVELQKSKQNFFIDRSVYYSSFPIQEQAQKGEWSYELKPVYLIGILDFVFPETKQEKALVHEVKLKDQNCRVFYEKLTFIYIELPKFKKALEQLNSQFDKWLYLFRHLPDLDVPPPPTLQEEVFEELFEVTEIAKFSIGEWRRYQGSLKTQRDWYAIELTRQQELQAREEEIQQLQQEAQQLQQEAQQFQQEAQQFQQEAQQFQQEAQQFQQEAQQLQQEAQQFQQEAQQFQQEAQQLQQEAQQLQQEALEAGLEQGRQQTIALITRQLSRRFQQELPGEMRSRLTELPFPQLEALGDVLLEFATLADLEQWLAGRSES